MHFTGLLGLPNPTSRTCKNSPWKVLGCLWPHTMGQGVRVTRLLEIHAEHVLPRFEEVGFVQQRLCSVLSCRMLASGRLCNEGSLVA